MDKARPTWGKHGRFLEEYVEAVEDDKVRHKLCSILSRNYTSFMMLLNELDVLPKRSCNKLAHIMWREYQKHVAEAKMPDIVKSHFCRVLHTEYKTFLRERVPPVYTPAPTWRKKK